VTVAPDTAAVRPADSGGRAASAPVIVLAPVYSGADALRSLLAGHPDLACTTSTGLLPLCQQAMATWGNADRRPGRPPSPLARTTTRALVASVISTILIREGKSRWCEVAAVNPEGAEAFGQLYPGTRFLCLYRACPGVIRAALDENPWGLADPMLTPFTRAYPGSTVASLAACWVTQVSALLAFEQDHPGQCLRVRFEDLTADRPETAGQVTSFLDLASPAAGLPTVSLPTTTPAAPGPPDGLIPPGLHQQANDLLRQLGYPPMPAGS
jgi:hypothetical protein